MDLFLAELRNLVDYLKLRETGFDLLGQSWGGMFGPMYAGARPKGLRRLVLASGLASEETRSQGYEIIKNNLGDDHRDAINQAVRSLNFDTPEYKAAMNAFMAKHAYRSPPPFPPDLMTALKHRGETQIPMTM